MVKCLPEFEYFYCVLEKKNIIFKIRRSKVTDYAALINTFFFLFFYQDTWVVTAFQALQWVQDPTPIANLTDFAPWKC